MTAVILPSLTSLGLLTWILISEVFKRRMLGIAVFGMTTLHYIVLVAFPALYSSWDGFYYERVLGSAPSDLAIVYRGDLVFLLLFTLGYFAYGRKTKVGRTHLNPLTPVNRRLCTVLVACGVIVFGRQLLNPTFSVLDTRNYADLIEYPDLTSRLFTYAFGFLMWPSLFAASIVFVLPRRRNFTWLLSAILLLEQAIYAFINGLRGGVVWVGCTLILSCCLLRTWRFLIACIFLGVAVAPLLDILHEEIRWNTMSNGIDSRNIDMLGGALSIVVNEIGKPADVDTPNFLATWCDRAQGPRNSVVLYKEFHSGRGAGMRPIVASLGVVVPRTVWPEKPVGGSVDNTNLGAAIYLVQREKGNMGPQDMGPLLASAHAYWEGGWPWLCIAGIITGFFWKALVSWGSASASIGPPIAVLCLTASLPIDGFLTVLNPIYNYVLMLLKVVIPLLLLTRFNETLGRLQFRGINLFSHVRTPRKSHGNAAIHLQPHSD